MDEEDSLTKQMLSLLMEQDILRNCMFGYVFFNIIMICILVYISIKV